MTTIGSCPWPLQAKLSESAWSDWPQPKDLTWLNSIQQFDKQKKPTKDDLSFSPSVHHRRYKTTPCQKFWMLGFCVYGPRCSFLHGEPGNGTNTKGARAMKPFYRKRAIYPKLNKSPKNLELSSAESSSSFELEE